MGRCLEWHSRWLGGFFDELDDVWLDDVARPGMTWSNCKGAPRLRPHFLLDCSKLERNFLGLGKLVLGMQNIHQGCFRVVLDGSLGLINWRQDWTETLALVMWVAEICGEANCFNGCVCQLHVLPELWSKLRSRSVIEDRDERP